MWATDELQLLSVARRGIAQWKVREAFAWGECVANRVKPGFLDLINTNWMCGFTKFNFNGE